MARLNYTEQRKSFHCELKHCWAVWQLPAHPWVPQRKGICRAGRAREEHRGQGLTCTWAGPVSSLFQALLTPWNPEEAVLRALETEKRGEARQEGVVLIATSPHPGCNTKLSPRTTRKVLKGLLITIRERENCIQFHLRAAYLTGI